ncbi:MAG: response regulator [Elusimicrobia bacterium]|nr:response regulator [Elusimicrobiota bacterium]
MKKKILVVDDNVYIRNAVITALKAEGYFVMGAQNGNTAASIFNKFDFDMVITDYEMEEVGGLNLLKRIKRIKPDIDVIMMTAFPTKELRSRVLSYQNTHFLCKPLDIEKLRNIVYMHFQRKDKMDAAETMMQKHEAEKAPEAEEKDSEPDGKESS